MMKTQVIERSNKYQLLCCAICSRRPLMIMLVVRRPRSADAGVAEQLSYACAGDCTATVRVEQSLSMPLEARTEYACPVCAADRTASCTSCPTCGSASLATEVL